MLTDGMISEWFWSTLVLYMYVAPRKRWALKSIKREVLHRELHVINLGHYLLMCG